MVLAALRGEPSTVLAAGSAVSRAVCVSHLQAVSRRSGPLVARRAATALRCDPTVGGDAIVARVEADLAAREVLPVDAIGAEARIELAARRGETAIVFETAAVDRRHAWLASAIRGETVPDQATDDPMALAAQLISRQKRRLPIDGAVRVRAASLSADDPLLTAALVTIAPPAERAPLRARLASLAATDAERTLARE